MVDPQPSDLHPAAGVQPEQVVEARVPENAWKRVHFITPFLNTWRLFTVLILILLLQDLDGLAAAFLALKQQSIGMVFLAVGGALAGLLLFTGGFAYLSWRAMSYALTDQAVWMRSGILFRKAKHVRLERIQAVDVVQPLLGRLFGLGKLTVEAAGGVGSSIAIGYLRLADLESLRIDILARAAGVKSTTEAEEGALAQTSSPDYRRTTPIPVQDAPERLLYSVPPGRLLGAAATSPGLISQVVVVGLALAGLLGVSALLAAPVWPFLLVLGLPLLIILLSYFQTRFVNDFNFQVAVSADGIRVRRGLLETRSETIPPGRVHAVRVVQPLLWRLFGWYRVEFTQATRRTPQGGAGVATSTLLPVGGWSDAMLAVWLIIPDLGVEDPSRLFAEAVHGTSRTPDFPGISRKALVFNLLVYNRRAVSATRTCLISRDGLLNRRATFVPFERIQSVAVEAGPVDRLLGMANLTSCLVPGVVGQAVPHLSQTQVANLTAEVLARSNETREAEPPERWLARVRDEVPIGQPSPRVPGIEPLAIAPPGIAPPVAAAPTPPLAAPHVFPSGAPPADVKPPPGAPVNLPPAAHVDLAAPSDHSKFKPPSSAGVINGANESEPNSVDK